MRFREFKTKEASFFNEVDEIDQVKSSLIDLIGTLPKDEKTLKYLKQVQDTLKKQGVGSRVVGFLDAKSVVDKIPKDDDRSEALNKQLAGLIVTAEGTTKDKRTFLAQLIKDTLINTTKLFTPGKMNSLKDTITTYGSNPATTDIINKLATVTDYGVGPGEILLVALSQKLSKKGLGKGDLTVGAPVNGLVELKTYNKKGPRFYDNDTKPGSGYATANKNFINEFVKTGTGTKSGLGATAINRIYEELKSEKDIKKIKRFQELVTDIIDNLYPKAQTSTKKNLVASLLVDPTDANFLAGQANFLAGQASFENYSSIKTQVKGYLFLSLQSYSSFYFNKFEDINIAGLQIKFDTAYFIDNHQPNYHAPQMDITSST